MNRPFTTMYMLMSVDGKISTGPGNVFDFDADLPRVPGVSEGLHQYYDLEKRTDTWSFTTGKVKEKCFRIQENGWDGEQIPVTQVVLDSHHMSEECITFLSKQYDRVIVATNRIGYPIPEGCDNVSELYYPARSLRTLFAELKVRGCDNLTVQAGGTLNDVLLRAGLVDRINLIVAPLVVGGEKTPTLVDGYGLGSFTNLSALTTLQLVSVVTLQHNYLQLIYDVAKRRFDGLSPMAFD